MFSKSKNNEKRIITLEEIKNDYSNFLALLLSAIKFSAAFALLYMYIGVTSLLSLVVIIVTAPTLFNSFIILVNGIVVPMKITRGKFEIVEDEIVSIVIKNDYSGIRTKNRLSESYKELTALMTSDELRDLTVGDSVYLVYASGKDLADIVYKKDNCKLDDCVSAMLSY